MSNLHITRAWPRASRGQRLTNCLLSECVTDDPKVIFLCLAPAQRNECAKLFSASCLVLYRLGHASDYELLWNKKGSTQIQGRVLCGTPRLKVAQFLPFQNVVTRFICDDAQCLNSSSSVSSSFGQWECVGCHGSLEKLCPVAAVTLDRQSSLSGCCSLSGRGLLFLYNPPYLLKEHLRARGQRQHF